MTRPTLIVLAKSPVAGRVKTRLCPPLTHDDAALVARAALRDTLRAARRAARGRVVLALEGAPGEWLDDLAGDFEVVAQRGDGLAARIAAAFEAAGGPAVLVGMDTPHVPSSLLAAAAQQLDRHDAVLGPCLDGGFWVVGARRPSPSLFLGVPMSRADTGRCQLARLRAHGLAVAMLPRQRDVDAIDDAVAAARRAPHTEFASVFRELRSRMVVTS
jgi:rSAM/selenodomain-associated transferase 1